MQSATLASPPALEPFSLPRSKCKVDGHYVLAICGNRAMGRDGDKVGFTSTPGTFSKTSREARTGLRRCEIVGIYLT